MNSTTSVGESRSSRLPREIPGQYVVMGMLAFGAATTILVFVYWFLHTGPFRPLTEALGREFRNSIPKIEGGSHRGGPETIRIAMRVPFEPNTDNPETRALTNRVVELARQHTQLGRFEKFELHLFQMAPEKLARHLKQDYDVQPLLTHLPYPAEVGKDGSREVPAAK